MKTNNREQVLLLLTLVAVALLAANYLVLNPLQNAWKKRSQDIVELRGKVTAGQALVAREHGLRQRWDMMSKNTLPRDFSAAEQQLLQAFDRWSRDSKVTIMSINPQRKREAADYVSLQCQVEAAGDLGTITSFLYRLEEDPMALRVETMEISARDATGSQMVLSLLVSGLVLAPEERR
jgi:Tfp pilus assembly protein PilO